MSGVDAAPRVRRCARRFAMSGCAPLSPSSSRRRYRLEVLREQRRYHQRQSRVTVIEPHVLATSLRMVWNVDEVRRGLPDAVEELSPGVAVSPPKSLGDNFREVLAIRSADALPPDGQQPMARGDTVLVALSASMGVATYKADETRSRGTVVHWLVDLR